MIGRIKVLAVLLALGIPSIVSAHPGHGETDGYSVVHFLAEPAHALPLIGFLLVAVIGGSRLLRGRERSGG